jgi:large subunit ribosomal protein L13
MREYTIDVKNKPLGRVASEIANILQGKDDPAYDPKDRGEVRVYVQNIDQVKVTGKKNEQKIYYRHTGYMGHLKERTYKEAFARDPKWVLQNAVKGMLPKNRLQSERMKQMVFLSKDAK